MNLTIPRGGSVPFEIYGKVPHMHVYATEDMTVQWETNLYSWTTFLVKNMHTIVELHSNKGVLSRTDSSPGEVHVMSIHSLEAEQNGWRVMGWM